LFLEQKFLSVFCDSYGAARIMRNLLCDILHLLIHGFDVEIVFHGNFGEIKKFFQIENIKY